MKVQNIFRRLWKDESGVAIAELGICAPFLLIMAVILTDGGRFQLWKIAVADSVHTGTMYGAVVGGTSTSDPTSAVEAAMKQNLTTMLGDSSLSNAGDTESATFYCTCSNSTAQKSPCLPSGTMDCGTGTVLHYVSATIKVKYTPMIPALYPAGSTNLSVTSISQVISS